MNYKAIYREYRPKTFDQIAGQQHIVRSLTNALKSNRLSHAYLFSGPSGNGKTSIAKLFAKAVNCSSEAEIICNQCSNCIAAEQGNHPDIVEMDAASNNGVDDIRSLIEKVKYSPLQGKYKVYIIDEVHMLSLGAFNALLKTLEEPPSHVIFILATTEPHKVIPTIMSRCQRYDFTKVADQDIKDNMIMILEQEEIEYEESALDIIVSLSQGGVRKSLSILEQAIAFSDKKVKASEVSMIFGVVDKSILLELLEGIIDGDLELTLSLLNKIYDAGKNLEYFILDFITLIKEIIIYNQTENKDILEHLELDEVIHFASLLETRDLLDMIDILLKFQEHKDDLLAFLELSIIKMINLLNLDKEQIRENDLQDFEDQEPVTEEDLSKILSDSESTKDRLLREYSQESNKETSEIEEKALKNEKKKDVKDVKQVEKDKLDPINYGTEENLLALLAHADKEKRIVMNEKWNNLSAYNNEMNKLRYIKKLSQSTILAVGDNYLLVVVKNELLKDAINEESCQEEIANLLESIYQERMLLLALTVEESEELVGKFKERYKKGNLPEKITVQLPKKTTENNSIEAKAEKIFNGVFDIVEED